MEQKKKGSKIQGLIYDKIQEEYLRLVRLKEKLPIDVKDLHFLLINLSSILIELVERKDVMFPPITLDTIYVSEIAKIAIPFIKSYVDDEIQQGQREEHALKQMITILKQLNYDRVIVQLENTNLQKIQDQLLEEIGYKENEGSQHAITFQENLGVTWIHQVHRQGEECKVDLIKTPPFLYNVKEDQIAMKIYKQEKKYKLREVEIIEQFNNPHQPYLYSYIRYSNLLILFLKQHKFSFYHLTSNCIGPRKLQNNKNQNQNQKTYQGYLKICYSMIIALEALHKQGIVHRDLKPQNNMFDCQNNLDNINDLLREDITCVIIDYDRSKKLDSEGNLTQYECNEQYSPPEGIQEKYYFSYDIWQLGFIWLLLLNEKVLQNTDLSQIEDIQKIRNSKIEYQKSQKSENQEDKRKKYDAFFNEAINIKAYVQIDKVLHQMIKKMMQFNPEDRPKLEDIKLLIQDLISQNKIN